MESVVGTDLYVKKGETQPVANFRPKYWGLYFGAHWAPPCRKFTTDLKEFYAKVNAGCPDNEKLLEVIFCSMDGNDEHFERNFGLMDWLALPYKEEARLAALKVKYDVNAIPCFVIVDGTGTVVVSKDARQDVLASDHGIVIESW